MPNNPNIANAACSSSAPSILTYHKHGQFPHPPLLTNCTLKDDAFFSLPSSVLHGMKMRSDNQPKSNAVFSTPLCVIWHFSAPPVWKYTLNATQPRRNHQTVPRRCYCGRKPAHRFFTHTTEYLFNHKITHCCTYTTPDRNTTLADRLAICKAIHSNKYRPLKSS